MDRRTFIKGMASSVALSSIPQNIKIGSSNKEQKHPNIIFILCDDLGYGDLGCYGNPVIRTPHLDKLASEGMRFTDFYAASPVCSPSRAGAITGRTPNRTGIYDWIPYNSGVYLGTDEISVTRILKDMGYTTCHSGKWHLNSRFDGSEPTPSEHGFDFWFSTQNNANPSHYNPDNFIRNGEVVGELKGYSSTIIINEAIEFIHRVYRQPFIVFIWFHTPHETIDTPDEFVDWYPDFADRTKSEYYGNISQMDYEVGRLLQVIEDLNLKDNTLVMFTSDNGPEILHRYRGAIHSHGLPGPLRGMKLHIYEGGIRVPGIIRWPGNTHLGQVCHEPISCVDILPTFCEIAGAKVPDDRAIDGTSIVPIFKGKPIQRQVPLYWQYDRALSRPKIAIREGAWKLLTTADLQVFELYNLEDDWGETKNLVNSEPERVKTMAKTLKWMHKDVNQ